MNFWKFITTILIALILLWFLYPSRSEKTKKDVTELVLWAPGNLFLQMQPVLDYFEKENPQYKIIIGQSASRNMTADPQRFLCSVAGDASPDIIMFARNAIIEWASRGAFESLNKFLDEDTGKTNIVYPVSTNNVVQQALDEVIYKNNIYGIPVKVDDRILYYNKDLLIREGLVDKNGNAKPPETWKELEEYAIKLTKKNAKGRIKQLGFAPMFGNSWLYLYAWQNGAEFISPDGKTCTLNSPETVGALEYMVKIYDSLGGIKKVSAFQSSFQAAELDPFLTDKIAMKIDISDFLSAIAAYKPNMNFGTAPAPMPENRLKKGVKPITWLGGWCYSIPNTSKNKNDSWKLIRWLSSLKAKKMLMAEDSENSASQGKIYIPSLEFENDLNEYAYKKYVLNNHQLTEPFKQGYRLAVDLLQHSKYRPVTPVGQLLWTQHVIAYEKAVYHKYPSAKESLDESAKVVQKALDKVHNPATGKIIKWKWLVIIYISTLIILFLFIIFWNLFFVTDKNYFSKQWYEGLLCASPWIIGFAIFTGGPILFSIIISFCQYDILNPARWVGFENYKWIFTQDPIFWKSFRNTIYMVIGVPVGLVAGLAIALLLDLKLKGMTFYRTLFYLPAIVPAVASSILWMWIFNPTSGLLNGFLGFFGIAGPSWLQDIVWSKPSLIIMGLWGVGAGMIIWLAGLKGIPEHLYEAAEVDGAGVWSKFINITIPMLSPYIFFNLIMGLIGTFQIFAQSYIMTQGGPMNSTMFYVYHLFNTAFRYLEMGTASAMAWFLFILVFGLTMFQLWLSKKWVHYGGE